MCEYCEPPFKSISIRKDEIYIEHIKIRHELKAPYRPNPRWLIEANVPSGNLYGNINFCPMCGRKLKED